MHTKTVTYVKANANNLEVNEPLLVTQNGNAKYVIQSYEDYQYQQESLALLKLINLAEKSAHQPVSADEAFNTDGL